MSTQALISKKCKATLTDENLSLYHKNNDIKICKQCNRTRLKKYNSKLNPDKKIIENNNKKIQRLKLRFETMLAYGNECINCRENKILFLTLDHINNNGYLDRNNIGKGTELYA